MQDDLTPERALKCCEWITDALEYSGGTHTLADVWTGITEGRLQLWQGPEGCAVTEILVFPQKKVLHVFLAGGNMDQIIGFMADAMVWGRQQGCSGMTISGRKGWLRVLNRHGWHEKFVTMGIDL